MPEEEKRDKKLIWALNKIALYVFMENNKEKNLGFTALVVPDGKTKAPTLLADDSLEHFRQSVDNLLSKRAYFISRVLPRLKEGQDYYIIKGRKSLAKGGAEKLASIYNFIAEFKRDNETAEMLKVVPGLVAFVCNLLGKNGQLVGQGRGSSTLVKNQGDANKTIKIAQKSAFIDAVIRSTGLSDLFTQDVEDMPAVSVEATDCEPFLVTGENGEAVEGDTTKGSRINESFESGNSKDLDFQPATTKQIDLITRLVESKCWSEQERSDYLEDLSALGKLDASRRITRLLAMK